MKFGDYCRVRDYDDLPCPARDSGFAQCERIDPHGDGEHAISAHSIEHTLSGNGYRCVAMDAEVGS